METSRIKVYRNNRPVNGIRVTLEFWSGFSKAFYTNAEGVAFVQHSSTGEATIYVDGKSRGKMRTPGEEVVYL